MLTVLELSALLSLRSSKSLIEEFRYDTAKVIWWQIGGLTDAKIQFGETGFCPSGSGASIVNEWKIAALEEFGDFAARTVRKILDVTYYHFRKTFKGALRQLHIRSGQI
jgi:hypothetical protein